MGRAKRGPTNEPVKITSLADYERKFGGLAADSSMSYAVAQYFQNGGSVALIVRVAANDAQFATANVNGLLLYRSPPQHQRDEQSGTDRPRHPRRGH